jgi:hypothetical protein
MTTTDTPGSNPANHDKLEVGNWAEHEDGSLVFVLGFDENDSVIFNVYDLQDKAVPTYYTMALPLDEFHENFSFNPKVSTKKSKKTVTDKVKWLWHDKSPMPWKRVMRYIDRPTPRPVNVSDQLTAATRIADSLDQHFQKVLTREHIEAMTGEERRDAGNPAKTIMQRLKNAMNELVH